MTAAIARIAALTAGVVLACAAPGAALQRNYRFDYSDYGFALPAGVWVSKTMAGPYDLYTLRRGRHAIVEFYVGNEPIDTAFVEHPEFVRTETINRMPARTIIYGYPNDTQSRETIIALGSSRWPKFVHAWYAYLPVRERLQADAIIASIGPMRAPLSEEQSNRFAQLDGPRRRSIMDLGKLEITFCGHATFKFKTPGGKFVMIDPFLDQNPATPAALKRHDRLDALFITHGHFDHIADAVRLAKDHGATCVCILETAAWLKTKGIEKSVAINKGGSTEVEGVRVTMTHAVHSCGIQDGDRIVYGGEAAGYVMTFENGVRIYHAGDTAAFSDMKIIGELYKPDLALLPIGDFYTMDPVQGAYAIRLLGVKNVIPMHYGTFPILTGTPERLRELTKDVAGLDIIDLRPGETLTGEMKRTIAV